MSFLHFICAIRKLSIGFKGLSIYYSMTNLRKLLAENIKKRRKSIEISQTVLAERVGTSTHYIGQIEQCKKFPSSEMLERIAEALEMDSPDLFSRGAFSIEAIKRFYEEIKSDFDIRLANLVKSNLNETVGSDKSFNKQGKKSNHHETTAEKRKSKK